VVCCVSCLISRKPFLEKAKHDKKAHQLDKLDSWCWAFSHCWAFSRCCAVSCPCAISLSRVVALFRVALHETAMKQLFRVGLLQLSDGETQQLEKLDESNCVFLELLGFSFAEYSLFYKALLQKRPIVISRVVELLGFSIRNSTQQLGKLDTQLVLLRNTTQPLEFSRVVGLSCVGILEFCNKRVLEFSDGKAQQLEKLDSSCCATRSGGAIPLSLHETPHTTNPNPHTRKVNPRYWGGTDPTHHQSEPTHEESKPTQHSFQTLRSEFLVLLRFLVSGFWSFVIDDEKVQYDGKASS